jgi:hypothetical protein
MKNTIKSTGYAHSCHGFDMEGLPEKLYMPAVQQAAKCRLTEASGGNLINADTGKELSRNYACAGLGATVGCNKTAHQKSIEDVLREVKSVLKLESR